MHSIHCVSDPDCACQVAEQSRLRMTLVQAFEKHIDERPAVSPVDRWIALFSLSD